MDQYLKHCMYSSINSNFIALIPKKDTLELVRNFGLINLCNVPYKLVFKVIINRLRSIMPLIICRMQSVFILGQLITDNIIVAYELLHSMKHNKGKKEWAMAVKFDMSKTYDRIEWPYLEVVLTSLGFFERWIHLTMLCVLSVQYSVIINGSLGEVFSPMRRLRKGEPLSPYLFLLCTERFNSLMDKAK